MIGITEQFLTWATSEIVLSGLLFLSYHLWIKHLGNPLDRFSFLCLSFLAILILPWVPLPVLAEPLMKSLVSGAATVLKVQFHMNSPTWTAWIAPFLSRALPALLRILYLSLLCFRSIRISSSIWQIQKIAESGTPLLHKSFYPVIQHDFALPPMNLGILKPRILIPKEVATQISESELDLIIQHEEEHIRRSDGLSNFLRVLTKEILLFSPFIRHLALKFEEEMEMSVDAAIVARNQRSTRSYAHLLVKVADSVHPLREIETTGTYLSNSSLKKRIRVLHKSPRKRSKALSHMAFGFFLLFGTLGISLFGSQTAFSKMTSLEAIHPESMTTLKSSDFSSARILNCSSQLNSSDPCQVSLQLKHQSQKRLAELSTKDFGKSVDIMMDGKVICSLVLKTFIKSPFLQITTNLGLNEAERFVKRINSGGQ